VHVVASVEPRPQPSELVQQRDRLLDHVTHRAQPAAVRLATAGDVGPDANGIQLAATPRRHCTY